MEPNIISILILHNEEFLRMWEVKWLSRLGNKKKLTGTKSKSNKSQSKWLVGKFCTSWNFSQKEKIFHSVCDKNEACAPMQHTNCLFFIIKYRNWIEAFKNFYRFFFFAANLHTWFCSLQKYLFATDEQTKQSGMQAHMVWESQDPLAICPWHPCLSYDS